MPLVTLFDRLVPPPPPGRVRRATDNNYADVRRVKAGAWQARVWLGTRHGGSLNLGLFTVAKNPPPDPRDHREAGAEWAAARASRVFRELFDWSLIDREQPFVHGPRGLQAAVEALKAKQDIPSDVLPPRVKRVAGGYRGYARTKGVTIETGVTADPWACYEVVCARLAVALPPPPSRYARVLEANQERDRRRRRLLTLADFLAA